MRAYLTKTAPNPAANRSPWHQLVLPCYAGLFLWMGFYENLAAGSIDRAPYGTLLLALIAAGLFCHYVFFLIPATMGMQTGYPLGVIGSSTFGSRGGEVVPGLVVGAVIAAWLGYAAYYAAQTILAGAGRSDEALSPVRLALTAAWILAFLLAARGGVRWMALLAAILAVFPLGLLIAGLYSARLGVEEFTMDVPEPYAAFVRVIHLTTAFFAAMAAASPGMGRYVSSKKDLRRAGLLGIAAPITVAGMLSLLAAAGWKHLNAAAETYSFTELARSSGGALGAMAPWLLLIGSIPASGFLAWMAWDSLAVMLPNAPRSATALAVSGVAFGVAASGAPADFFRFVTIAGAICAPFCGIMTADYWQHDKRWPHTRPGVNYAGFGAWILGGAAGLLPLFPLPEHYLVAVQPAAVLSWVVGFAGYVVLGNLGLKPYRKHRRKRVRSLRWSPGDAEIPDLEERRDQGERNGR